MELGLRGDVAAITGGSEGIGLATALALSAEGARVAICARRAESLENAAAAIRNSPQEHERQLVADRGIPLGRIGRSEEVASLITFLASEQAAYITGASINIDGGLCNVV